MEDAEEKYRELGKVEAHDDVVIGGDGDDARQLFWIGPIVVVVVVVVVVAAVVVERQFDISPFQMKDNVPPGKFGPLWPSRRSTRRELRAADAMVTVGVGVGCWLL